MDNLPRVRLSGHRPLAALAALGAATAFLIATGCGREHEPDLVNGKAQFVQKCSSCHTLGRANAQGTQGPNLDEAFEAALTDGMTESTLQGVVRRQIANVRRGSIMPEDLVTGNDAIDVAAYVAASSGKSGQDTGALATAGLAGATTGEQIFQGAGCGSCHELAKAQGTGTVGPSLEQLAQEAGQREQGKNPQQYVEEAILDPEAFTVEGFQQGAMPSFEGQLTDKQLKTLTDFLLGEGQ
jgi:mono/diheme cytochrome c family protein